MAQQISQELLRAALSGLKLQEQSMTLAENTLNEALEGVAPDQIDICKGVLQLVYDNLK